MKAKLFLTIIWLALMVAVPGAQAGVVIYDNGAPNSMWGNEMASYLSADSFTFTSPLTVTDVRFWAVYANYSPPGVYNGSIVWQIYSDSAGQPGTPLYSDTVFPTQTFSHDTAPSPLDEGYWGKSYQFDFSITPTPLAAGTYWLALHNGDLTMQDDSNLYWEASFPAGTMADAAANSPGWESWTIHSYSVTDGGGNLAFQLSGVPIPGAVWLLGSGLLGLGGLRRFRKS